MTWTVKLTVTGASERIEKENKKLETNDYDLVLSTFQTWMNNVFNNSFNYDTFRLYVYDSNNKIYYEFNKFKF